MLLNERDAKSLDSVQKYLQSCYPPQARKTNITAPKFQPELWNVRGIQEHTNCYCYAANNCKASIFSDGYFRTYGKIKSPKTLNMDFNKAVQHGFIPAPFCEGIPLPVEGHYLTALFSVHCTMGIGSHWYRQDPDGLWSHKDGAGPVSREDAFGKLIHDPRKAAYFENMTYFVSFFYVGNEGLHL